MEKILWVCLLATALTSCGSGEYYGSTPNTDIVLVAEKDSVRVYRAVNNGMLVYFTNKGGVAIGKFTR